MIKKWSLERAR